jgi:hypothetical protein
MISRTGERITTLGLGTGYVGDCIKSNDLGASFSTPKVGTQVYLAKAYWRKNNINLTPLEIRASVVLSTDLDTNFQGKYASGGLLNTYKLMLAPFGFIQYKDGIIRQLDSIRIDTIGLTLNETTITSNDVGAKKLLGGLYFIDNKLFGFFRNEQVWRRIDVTTITVRIFVEGKEEIYTNITDLNSQISQIAISPPKK